VLQLPYKLLALAAAAKVGRWGLQEFGFESLCGKERLIVTVVSKSGDEKWGMAKLIGEPFFF